MQFKNITFTTPDTLRLFIFIVFRVNPCNPCPNLFSFYLSAFVYPACPVQFEDYLTGVAPREKTGTWPADGTGVGSKNRTGARDTYFPGFALPARSASNNILCFVFLCASATLRETSNLPILPSGAQRP